MGSKDKKPDKENRKQKKIKILFILNSLEGGGTQRVFLNLLRYIDRKIFDPILVVLKLEGEYEDFLPREIFVYDLQVTRARYSFLQLARIINRIKPEMLFSSTPYIDSSVYLSLKFLGYKPKVLVRSPSFLSIKFTKLPIITRLLTRLFYLKADLVVVPTIAIGQDLQRNFNVSSKKIKIIPNPIDIATIRHLSSAHVSHPWFERRSDSFRPVIIAMGRLEEPKGFTFLLQAFSIIRQDFQARLIILGKGNQHDDLRSLAMQLHCEEHVDFLGFQKNPYRYIAAADVFVLSSLWEGFPNALIEAMACGIPVVSTNCRSGPNEIIEHEKSGLLVPVANPEAMAKAVLQFLRDNTKAVKFANAARLRSREFRLRKVISMYENTFMRLYNRT